MPCQFFLPVRREAIIRGGARRSLDFPTEGCPYILATQSQNVILGRVVDAIVKLYVAQYHSTVVVVSGSARWGVAMRVACGGSVGGRGWFPLEHFVF